jgi:hypothetical protein
MRKVLRIVLVLTVALMVNALPADAHGGHFRHGGGHVGVGVFVGPGFWGPGWWGPYPYYPYYPPQVIVREPPEIYVEPAPQAEEPRYWYYCQEPQGYYPNVKKCPKGWMKVVPPADSTEGEE